MDKVKIAGELVRMAEMLLSDGMSRESKEFSTEYALNKYLRDHPGANKSDHTVKKSGPKSQKAPSSDETKLRATREMNTHNKALGAFRVKHGLAGKSDDEVRQSLKKSGKKNELAKFE